MSRSLLLGPVLIIIVVVALNICVFTPGVMNHNSALTYIAIRLISPGFFGAMWTVGVHSDQPALTVASIVFNSLFYSCIYLVIVKLLRKRMPIR